MTKKNQGEEEGEEHQPYIFLRKMRSDPSNKRGDQFMESNCQDETCHQRRRYVKKKFYI